MPPTTRVIAGSVATITLDNPEKHNALTAELLNSLGEDLQAVSDDQSVRVVVVTNSGPSFCAGANLGASANVTPTHDLVAILRLIQEMEKPVVGRIAGRCLGGGVGLAAACDISIAVSSARFGFSEVRLGVAPAIISVVCLAKLRAADAAELFLTGEQFDADRAVTVGLITRSVEAEELDDAVATTIDRLLRGAPGALAAAKWLLQHVPQMQRDEAFERTRAMSANLFASPEATAGIAAFSARRPAPWVPE
jgi:methylglutaconyl-CoA hydratase